jgi:hypothetical protein
VRSAIAGSSIVTDASLAVDVVTMDGRLARAAGHSAEIIAFEA